MLPEYTVHCCAATLKTRFPDTDFIKEIELMAF
jgi:hypothetical protein